MKKKKKSKLSAFLTSVLMVAAVLVYLCFGDQIAEFCSKIGLDFDNMQILTTEVSDGELEVHVIDVGQGDSILVRTKEAAVLIDAGPNGSESALRTYLKSCGVEKLDLFICTHPHEDHIGGADMVVNEIKVSSVLMPETDVSTVTVTNLLDAIEKRGTALKTPTVGDVLTFGDMSFTVLAPDESVSDGGNNSSIVVRLTYGGTSFMFTGDAEALSERKILDSFTESELKCDFLKVGHHGSSTSTSEAFLKAVSPTYAAISCEKGNSYGHPHRETVSLLKKYGITGDRLLRTDESGTVAIVSDGISLSVK